MSKKKTPKVGNFALAMANQERRRSNAAGKHLDKRDKRARTRSAAKSRAMREQE